jgi:hypothetical protein
VILNGHQDALLTQFGSRAGTDVAKLQVSPAM